MAFHGKGHRKGYEDGPSNGHAVGGWSPSPDGAPETFKALQGLSKALKEHDDEKCRLFRENEQIRIENQRVRESNLSLEHSIRRLQADLESQRRVGVQHEPAVAVASRGPPPAPPSGRPRSFTFVRKLENHKEPVHAVAVKGDNIIATGSWDRSACLCEFFDETDYRPLPTLQDMGGLYSIAFSRTVDDVLACTSNDKQVYIWNYEQTRLLHTLQQSKDGKSGHTDEVNGVAFHDKQNVVCSASDDKKAIIWDFKEGMALRTLDQHDAQVYGAVFLGETLQFCVATCCLAVDGKASFQVFDMRDKKEVVKKFDHRDDIIGIDFCRTHNLLATGSDDGTIRLYDVRKWVPVCTIDTNNDGSSPESTSITNEVKRIAFSPDGTMLAAAGSDKSVRVYGRQDDKWSLWDELSGHEDCVFDVAWGQSSKMLVSASHDKTSRVWRRTR